LQREHLNKGTVEVAQHAHWLTESIFEFVVFVNLKLANCPKLSVHVFNGTFF